MAEEKRADVKDILKAGGNQSLARGLSILLHFADAEAELGVRDIARRMEMSTSITHRLVRTLAELGFLEQNPENQRYRVGYKAFEVGNTYLKFNSLETIAPAELSTLANEHEINAFLGIIQGRSVIYLMTMQSSGPIAVRSVAGSRTPLHATAIAKAILADYPDDTILEMLGSGPLEQVASRTRTKPLEFLKDVKDARRKGYSMADSEAVDGVFSVGAPIRDRSGRAIAAISGSVPRHLHKPADTPKLAQLVINAAARISKALGVPPDRIPAVHGS